MLTLSIVTIFPEFFVTPLSLSIPNQAAEAGSVVYRVVNLRDYTHDRHRTVDDYAYGGGPGMVILPEPVFDAVESIQAKAKEPGQLVMLTPM